MIYLTLVVVVVVVVVAVPDLPRYGSPLGMEDGRIGAAQITMLAGLRCSWVFFHAGFCVDTLRPGNKLQYAYAWFEQSDVFAEVDLKCPHRFTGVSTEVQASVVHTLMKSFRLCYSMDGLQFHDVIDLCTNESKVN